MLMNEPSIAIEKKEKKLEPPSLLRLLEKKFHARVNFSFSFYFFLSLRSTERNWTARFFIHRFHRRIKIVAVETLSAFDARFSHSPHSSPIPLYPRVLFPVENTGIVIRALRTSERQKWGQRILFYRSILASPCCYSRWNFISATNLSAGIRVFSNTFGIRATTFKIYGMWGEPRVFVYLRFFFLRMNIGVFMFITNDGLKLLIFNNIYIKYFKSFIYLVSI